MPLCYEDPVKVTGEIKVVGTKHRRRDVVRLLGCMAVAVACGCDPSGIKITSVTAKPKLPLELELRVGFELTGASSIKSVKLRGTIGEVEFARVSGELHGSTVKFKVKISLTTGRIHKAFQNTIDKRKLQGSIKLEAVLNTRWVGEVTVNEEWSGKIALE